MRLSGKQDERIEPSGTFKTGENAEVFEKQHFASDKIKFALIENNKYNIISKEKH